jgi:hypothetical protein
MDWFWSIAFIVAVAVIAIAVVVGQQLQEQERRKRLQAVAAERGFSFSAEAEPGLLPTLAGFHLFSQGRSRRIMNVMRTNVEGINVSLFDYKYTTSSGKHSHTHRQTVLLFESEKIRLPRFTLRPEHMFHKLGSFLGYQDIDFEARPKFSDNYLLQGDDEARIREVFREPVLAYYAEHSGLCTEGNGQQLLYYRADERIEPGWIEDFMQWGLDVVDLFCEKDDALEDVDLLDLVLEDAQSALENLVPSGRDGVAEV